MCHSSFSVVATASGKTQVVKTEVIVTDKEVQQKIQPSWKQELAHAYSCMVAGELGS